MKYVRKTIRQMLEAVYPLQEFIQAVQEWIKAEAPYFQDQEDRYQAAASALIESAQTLYAKQTFVVSSCIAVSFQQHGQVRHLVRPSAVLLVHETQRPEFSSSWPKVLETPGYLYVKRPAVEALLEQVTEIAWALVSVGEDKVLTLMYRYRDDMFYACRFDLAEKGGRWGFRTTPVVDPDRLEDRPLEALLTMGRAVLLWLFTFAALIEAENAPIDVTDEDSRDLRKRRKRREKAPSPWKTKRYVYLDHSAPRGTSKASEHESREGLQALKAKLIRVRGHLKQQAYGPGRSLRKTIYVQAFESTRYVDPDRETVVAARPGVDRL